ncbi:FYVE and coiled-coil domain-containing 1 isoform X1 [Babesia ovis]|uniref:FYVE and coiled-coil domain-containing 1 isoform X1 n=1 Tax=Babesia ovis TaxID=5869 RepID=A0A9W5TB63_BABOV|nr:FYVE and coiled-coil domain-containing 1 isoform X1 [Babesia ovis]
MYGLNKSLMEQRGITMDPDMVQIYLLYSGGIPHAPAMLQENPEELCDRLKPLMPLKMREIEPKSPGSYSFVSSEDLKVALKQLWVPHSELHDIHSPYEPFLFKRHSAIEKSDHNDKLIGESVSNDVGSPSRNPTKTMLPLKYSSERSRKLCDVTTYRLGRGSLIPIRRDSCTSGATQTPLPTVIHEGTVLPNITATGKGSNDNGESPLVTNIVFDIGDAHSTEVTNEIAGKMSDETNPLSKDVHVCGASATSENVTNTTTASDSTLSNDDVDCCLKDLESLCDMPSSIELSHVPQDSTTITLLDASEANTKMGEQPYPEKMVNAAPEIRSRSKGTTKIPVPTPRKNIRHGVTPEPHTKPGTQVIGHEASFTTDKAFDDSDVNKSMQLVSDESNIKPWAIDKSKENVNWISVVARLKTTGSFDRDQWFRKPVSRVRKNTGKERQHTKVGKISIEEEESHRLRSSPLVPMETTSEVSDPVSYVDNSASKSISAVGQGIVPTSESENKIVVICDEIADTLSVKQISLDTTLDLTNTAVGSDKDEFHGDIVACSTTDDIGANNVSLQTKEECSPMKGNVNTTIVPKIIDPLSGEMTHIDDPISIDNGGRDLTTHRNNLHTFYGVHELPIERSHYRENITLGTANDGTDPPQSEGFASRSTVDAERSSTRMYYCNTSATWSTDISYYSTNANKALSDLIRRNELQQSFEVYSSGRFKTLEASISAALHKVGNIDVCDDASYNADQNVVADIVDCHDPGAYGSYLPLDLVLQNSEGFMLVQFDKYANSRMDVAHRLYGGWFEMLAMVVVRSKNTFHRDVGWALSSNLDNHGGSEKHSNNQQVFRISYSIDKEDAYLDATISGITLRFPLWYYVYLKSGISVGLGASEASIAKTFYAFDIYMESIGQHEIIDAVTLAKASAVAEALEPVVPISSKISLALLRDTSEVMSDCSKDAVTVFQDAYTNLLKSLDDIFSGDKIYDVPLLTGAIRRAHNQIPWQGSLTMRAPLSMLPGISSKRICRCMREYFLQDVPNDISTYPGISASVIDIDEYNSLARMRGFKEINTENHVAYLLYTHRGIHQSLIFHNKRHMARWDTVKTIIDHVLGQRVFNAEIGEDPNDSWMLTLKFDYEWHPLHDLTTNAYDEIHKLELYMDLRRGALKTTNQYDVLSLANATSDFVILGYEAQNENDTNKTVVVHRTRGCWVQFASLVTVNILSSLKVPTLYTLTKDLSPFKTCYDELATKVDNIGFMHHDWRDSCVDPDILDSQVRLTFEDYLWEFYNMWIDGLHPYQQSVVIILAGALRKALYMIPSNPLSEDITNEGLEAYTENSSIGPYLLLVKRMLIPKVVNNKFIATTFGTLDVTRVDYIFGTWLAYLAAVKLLVREFLPINLEDYVQSVSPEPLMTSGQRKVVIAFVVLTVMSLCCALCMVIARCHRRHKAFFAQRQQTLLFYTMSSSVYDETEIDSNSTNGTNGSLQAIH